MEILESAFAEAHFAAFRPRFHLFDSAARYKSAASRLEKNVMAALADFVPVAKFLFAYDKVVGWTNTIGQLVLDFQNWWQCAKSREKHPSNFSSAIRIPQYAQKFQHLSALKRQIGAQLSLQCKLFAHFYRFVHLW